jgi:hypothetical protein
MQYMKTKNFLIILIMSVSLLSSCRLFNRAVSTFPVKVSDAIEIGTDWTEIVLPTPLTARYGTQQYLELFFNTKKTMDNLGGVDWKTMKLLDGRIAKLDVFIYDENGVEYELFINTGNKGVGFSLNSPKSKDYVPFPEVKYTKIKVRSSIPIKIEKIEWAATYSIG